MERISPFDTEIAFILYYIIVSFRLITSKFPFTTTNWARIATAIEPGGYALQMKGVPALPPDNRALISWILDSRCHSLKGRLTDSTHVVIGIPGPLGNAVESTQTNSQPRRWLCRQDGSVAGTLARHAILGDLPYLQ